MDRPVGAVPCRLYGAAGTDDGRDGQTRQIEREIGPRPTEGRRGEERGSCRAARWGFRHRGTVVNQCSRQLRAPRALPDDEDRDLTFDELVDKYEKKLYNLILRHVGDPDEAADLTQATFVNA